MTKCWFRRSRLVAREYAFLQKHADTYSPASSTHILNLLPLMYLQQCGSHDPESKAETRSTTLGCMDVKDAFLMVPQPHPVKIKVRGEDYIVEKNLPGQRVGARLWHQHLRKFMEDHLQCSFSAEHVLPSARVVFSSFMWMT